MESSVAVEVVRRIGSGDVPGVAGSMAKSFFDDPVVGRWRLAGLARRMRRLARGVELLLYRGCRGHSEVYGG